MLIPIDAYNICEYYLIDEYGNVYNTKTKRYIKPTLDKHGCYQIKIYDINGERKSRLIHRLVAMTFLPYDKNNLYAGNYSNQLTVDHIDGNKTNNYYKNLRWVSFLDNTNLAKKNGHNNPQANYTPITEELISEIIDDLLNLYSIKDICKRHNVSVGEVQRIKQKRHWKQLTKDIEFPKTYAHKSREDTLTIVYYSLNIDTKAETIQKYLLDNYNISVSMSQIYNIKNKETLLDYIKYIEQNKFEPSETIETA